MLPSITIEYSLEREVDRVRSTSAKLAWFRERKYPLTIPPPLRDGEQVDDAALAEVVRADYDATRYESAAKSLAARWQDVDATCTRSLYEIFPDLTQNATIRLTRYGVGGSYHAPATIVANIELRQDSDLLKTLLHETIHLGLRTIVEEDDLDHWVKERLVDRVSMAVNPTYGRLQKIHADILNVDTVFDATFPDTVSIVGQLRRV